MLGKFQLDTDKGEWISIEQYEPIVHYIRSLIPIKAMEVINRSIFGVGDLVRFKHTKVPIQYGRITKLYKDNRFEVETCFSSNANFNKNQFKAKKYALPIEDLSLIEKAKISC